jgi:hypothetical protein
MRFRLEPASKRAHEISKNYESLRGMYAGPTYQKSHRVFAFQVISCPPTTGVHDPWSFVKSRQIIAARKSSKGESCP